MRSPCSVALEQRLNADPSSEPVSEPNSEAGVLGPDCRPALRAFYAARQFAPLFTTDEGYDVRADALREAIAASEDDGISAALLPLDLSPFHGPEERADAELRVATTYLLLAQDLARGRVSAAVAHWHGPGRPLDRAALLRDAELDPSLSSLAFLAPRHQGYRRLRAEYVRLRNLARRGGWPLVPAGKPLQEGDRDPRVAILRERLRASGELNDDQSPDDPQRFDPVLGAALRTFQRRHGLAEDGVLGGKTLTAIRVSAQAAAARVALNLERWRWLPDDLGRTHLWVNVPSYELQGFRDGEEVLSMRVVVGRRDWQTPLFEGTLTHFELNPSWHITRRIAGKELLPLLRKQPTALGRLGIRLLDGNGKPVDPSGVDWNAVGEQMPYRLVQGPGKRNPLGSVKFVLPNRYGISLHDSPSRWAFEATDRRLSHGCIRVERPLDLIEFLLTVDDGNAARALEEWLPWSATRKVMVSAPVPVRLVYFTAWVGEDGALQLREDVYGRDTQLRSLDEKVAKLRRASAPAALATTKRSLDEKVAKVRRASAPSELATTERSLVRLGAVPPASR